jgi:hypothetical protein
MLLMRTMYFSQDDARELNNNIRAMLLSRERESKNNILENFINKFRKLVTFY